MMLLALSSAFLTALMCGAYANLRVKWTRRIDLLSWSMLAVAGVYGLIKILIILTPNMSHARYWLHMSYSDHVYHAVAVLVMAISLISGWLAMSSINNFPRRPNCAVQSSRHLFYWLSIAFLAVAVLSQIIYTFPLGGPIAALEYSLAVRSGVSDVYNPFTALARLPGFAFVSTVILMGLILDGRSRLSVRVVFAISLLFSIYVLYSWLARLYIVYVLATIPIAIMLYRTSSPVRFVLPSAAVCVIGVFIIYQISVVLNLKGQDSFVQFVTKEFSFVYIAFKSQIMEYSSVNMNFASLWASPFYILPGSVVPDFVPSAVELNTIRVTGSPKGVAGNTSGMPVDLITLGLMQFGILGLGVTSALFGAFLRLMQSFIDQINVRGIRVSLSVFSGFMFSIHGLFYSDPSVFIKEAFPLIVALSLIAFLFRRRNMNKVYS